jgi:SAM-dependent methyltransferase
MNQKELKYFKGEELSFYDTTSLPIGYLVKTLFIKMRRRVWGKFADKKARFAWTVSAVSDASGPVDNVRNYRERQTIRSIISGISGERAIGSACEVGCGYGRLTMVLEEFAKKTVGFEREPHLVDIARSLLPNISFYQVDSLDKLSSLDSGPFDLVMTCTVLQHLTDKFCVSVLDEIKKIAPAGYLLLIEKTKESRTTDNIHNGDVFISRARTSEMYARMMEPYTLISVSDRVVEPGYGDMPPGTCMLFKSPLH